MAKLPMYETPDDMPADYRKMVMQLLESQGYREVMAAHVFGHGLKFVPDLRTKMVLTHQITEELEHFEEVEKLYAGFGGNLLDVVTRRLEAHPDLVPYASSWLEMAVTLCLYDRAGYWQIREYRNCTYKPMTKIVNKILEEEEGHENLGAALLREMCADPIAQAKTQEFFNKWFDVSALSFGRPNTPGSQFCIDVGLKERTPTAILQDFVDELKPILVDCGLTFPAREKLRLELPEEVDFSLPAAA